MGYKRILVVEDDRDIAHLLELHFKDLGYEASLAYDGASALREAESKRYDVIVLDLMLPEIDGLEVCRRLRAQSSYTPILMLTAKSTELDRVVGLELGADDYLTKPFSIRELLARVKALLRRTEALATQPEADAQKVLQIGDLVIDVERRKVTLRDKIVELTAKEFALLEQFARHPGKVYTRSQLLDLVWNYGYDGYEHTVNSHINRLRAKIEKDPARPKYIRTVWGVGYRLAEAEELSV